MSEHQPDLCGIDGLDGDPVTHHAFNRWARRAMIHHVQPMKDSLRSMERTVDDFVRQQDRWQARIEGGLWATRVVIVIVGVILSLLIGTANLPQIIKVISGL